MLRRVIIFLLSNGVLFAAGFQNGQAARSVLGQSSFSSQDAGVRVTSMIVSGNNLYAADTTHHVLTFDLSRIPGSRQDFALRHVTGCGVCGFAPASVVNQSVAAGVAGYSQWGKSVAMVDAGHHHVRFWSDSTDGKTEIVLGQTGDVGIGASTLINPISVAIDGKHMFVGDAALHRVLIWNSLPTRNDQPADTVLGQADFSSSILPDPPTPSSIETPTAIVSNGEDVFVADVKARRILVFSPGEKLITPESIVNSASFADGPFAPGTLISINGFGLSDQPEQIEADQRQPLPKQLAGMEAVFDGQTLPLISVSSNKAEMQLPYGFGGRTSSSFYIRVKHGDGSVTVSAAVTLHLTAANPGLFAFGGTEPRSGILLHSSDSRVEGGVPVTKQNPVRPGEIVTILATGLGSVIDSGSSDSATAGVPGNLNEAAVAVPVKAEINGHAAEVVEAKLLPDGIGVYEIAILVPAGVSDGHEGRLQIEQNGYASNTVTLALH
jgi:uncharacterized protein (TIGR03437 family)